MTTNKSTSAATLTAHQLRSVLSYDDTTGLFRWLVKPSPRIPLGAVAGTKSVHGYIVIKVGAKYHRAHRLAWLYVHGDWPEQLIDHINGVRDDNRIVNLRPASGSINTQNRRVASAKKKSCDKLGVYRLKPYGRFNARLRIGGRDIYLGTFCSAEQAHEAYVAAKRVHHAGCTI